MEWPSPHSIESQRTRINAKSITKWKPGPFWENGDCRSEGSDCFNVCVRWIPACHSVERRGWEPSGESGVGRSSTEDFVQKIWGTNPVLSRRIASQLALVRLLTPDSSPFPTSPWLSFPRAPSWVGPEYAGPQPCFLLLLQH